MRYLISVEDVEDVFEVLKEEGRARAHELVAAVQEPPGEASRATSTRWPRSCELLALRDNDKGLSAGEKSMFVKARQVLVSELAFALDISEDEAMDRLSRRSPEPGPARPLAPVPGDIGWSNGRSSECRASGPAARPRLPPCHGVGDGGSSDEDDSMSDAPQGPDWWQASDDKWYPPPRPQMPGDAPAAVAPGYAPPGSVPGAPLLGPPAGTPSGGYPRAGSRRPVSRARPATPRAPAAPAAPVCRARRGPALTVASRGNSRRPTAPRCSSGSAWWWRSPSSADRGPVRR